MKSIMPKSCQPSDRNSPWGSFPDLIDSAVGKHNPRNKKARTGAVPQQRAARENRRSACPFLSVVDG